MSVAYEFADPEKTTLDVRLHGVKIGQIVKRYNISHKRWKWLAFSEQLPGCDYYAAGYCPSMSYAIAKLFEIWTHPWRVRSE